jgi:hypothetical protein
MSRRSRITRTLVYPLAFLVVFAVASVARTQDWNASTTLWVVFAVAALYMCIAIAVIHPPRRVAEVRAQVPARRLQMPVVAAAFRSRLARIPVRGVVGVVALLVVAAVAGRFVGDLIVHAVGGGSTVQKVVKLVGSAAVPVVLLVAVLVAFHEGVEAEREREDA